MLTPNKKIAEEIRKLKESQEKIDPKKVDALFTKLGSNKKEEKEEAEKELMRMGRPLIPVLKKKMEESKGKIQKIMKKIYNNALMGLVRRYLAEYFEHTKEKDLKTRYIRSKAKIKIKKKTDKDILYTVCFEYGDKKNVCEVNVLIDANTGSLINTEKQFVPRPKTP